MSDKCSRTGCGQFVAHLPGNCQLFKKDAHKSQCFTTTPTISIPTAELEELKRRAKGHYSDMNRRFIKDKDKLRDRLKEAEGLMEVIRHSDGLNLCAGFRTTIEQFLNR